MKQNGQSFIKLGNSNCHTFANEIWIGDIVANLHFYGGKWTWLNSVIIVAVQEDNGEQDSIAHLIIGDDSWSFCC